MRALNDVPPSRDCLVGPALQIAPALLGAVLRSDLCGASVTVRITEVEAYEGAEDPASHAFRGSTARTAVMFGPAGHLYCYFVYGMHWCANIVTGLDGTAAAVLLRAGEVIDGVEAARQRAAASAATAALASGPARLARVLGLSGAHSGADLLSPRSTVRLLSLAGTARFESGPRVGVSAAAERPWRFWLPGEPSVSRYRAAVRGRRGARRQTEPS